MILRYVAIFMGYNSGFENTFTYQFDYNTRFINNFLSTRIRKSKFLTDSTFNMISVVPSINRMVACKVMGEKALTANIPFVREKYEEMQKLERYEYYLQLLEEGYGVCFKYKEIPIDDLLRLHQEFRNSGYKNEWLHKKKKFKEYGIEVILVCSFTSFDFRLIMTVNDLESKKEIISGMVIRTKPDEIHFSSLFKDVIIEKDFLMVTQRFDEPKFKFSLSDIFNKKFEFEILEEGLDYIPYK